MLRIDNLSVELLSGRRLIENLNIFIAKGDKIAVIGEEGNGKSTILRAIARDKTLEEFAYIKGQIECNCKIGYLPQFIDPLWLSQTVLDYLLKDDPTAVQNFDNYALFDKFSEQFSRFQMDFDEKLPQVISTLSGGEKIKLQLIKLLVNENDLLCLDEPTNDLDLSTIEFLENFIKNSNQTIIFISHDEDFIRNTSNGILLFEQLKRKTQFAYTFAHLPYDEFMRVRQENLQRQTQIAESQARKDRERQRILDEQKQKVESALTKCPRGAPAVGKNLKDKMHTILAMNARFERERKMFLQKPDTEESAVLKFKDSSDLRRVIFDLDEIVMLNKRNVAVKMFLQAGDKAVIIGDNGIGKTTLLKILTERLEGKGYNIGVMPQDYEAYLSKYNNVTEFIESQSCDRETRSKIMTILGSLKMTAEEMQLPISSLSGGQKAKIILSNLMANNFDIIILDEPTRNLSPLTNPQLRRALKDFSGTILSVSHDRAFVREVADKVFKLTNNSLVQVYI